jgi:hypothetical protein
VGAPPPIGVVFAGDEGSGVLICAVTQAALTHNRTRVFFIGGLLLLAARS